MTTTQTLRFRVSAAAEDELQGFLLTHCTVEGIEELSDGGYVYYIPEAEWSDGFEAVLGEYLSAHPDVSLLGTAPLVAKDWNSEWEQSIEPLAITDELTITPSWKLEESRLLATKHTLIIDPKMSFGTGHHETTRLCLRAVEAITLDGMRVLDLGTGSGVLAMYALMRGATYALGVDPDEWSILNAAENRERNGFDESRFEIRKGTLGDAVAAVEVFDVIVANIHRNILLQLADALHKHVVASGRLILSGLLEYDAAEVRAAYELAGFTFVRQRAEQEWVALEFDA